MGIKKKVVCFALIATLAVPGIALAENSSKQYTESKTKGIVYMVPAVAVKQQEEKTLKKELEKIAKNTGNKSILGKGHPTGSYVYRTVMHHKKAKIVYRTAWAANQLKGGYKAKGSLYYNVKGGNSYSCSVGFGTPWGSVSFGGSTGSKRNSVGGMNIELPSRKHYYKIKAKKGYKSTPYTIQRKKKGNKKWKNWNHGIVKGVYYSVNAYAVKVK